MGFEHGARDAESGEPSIHDGSVIGTAREAWDYFTLCFDENRSEARSRGRTGWRSAWLGGLEDADVLVTAAIETLARRAEDRAARGKPFTRSGPGLLFAQIDFEKRTLVREEGRRRRVTATGFVDADGDPTDPLGALEATADTRHDTAADAELSLATDGAGLDPETAELRFLAACAAPIRALLEMVSPGRKAAIRDALARRTDGATDDENVPAAVRQSLRRGRHQLAGVIRSAALSVGIRIPSHWDNTFVDDVLARLIDLGHIRQDDLE